MKKLASGAREALALIRQSRVLSVMLLLILTLALLTTASVAWVTINRKTDSGGMQMGLDVHDAKAVYVAYMYDLSAGMGTNIKSAGTDGDDTLNVTDIDLNQYDTVFKAQNKYTPAFARITLIKSEAMPDDGIVTLTVDRAGAEQTGNSYAAVAYAEEGDTNPTSSTILRFTAFILGDHSDRTIETDPAKTSEQKAADLYHLVNFGIVETEQVGESTVEKTRFEVVEAYTTNTAASKTFIEKTGETYTKHTSLTVQVEYSASDWYTNEEGDTALNVYLYMTYDVTQIEGYMEGVDSGEISLGDNSVFFANDLVKITAGYAAKAN